MSQDITNPTYEGVPDPLRLMRALPALPPPMYDEAKPAGPINIKTSPLKGRAKEKPKADDPETEGVDNPTYVSAPDPLRMMQVLPSPPPVMYEEDSPTDPVGIKTPQHEDMRRRNSNKVDFDAGKDEAAPQFHPPPNLAGLRKVPGVGRNMANMHMLGMPNPGFQPGFTRIGSVTPPTRSRSNGDEKNLIGDSESSIPSVKSSRPRKVCCACTVLIILLLIGGVVGIVCYFLLRQMPPVEVAVTGAPPTTSPRPPTTTIPAPDVPIDAYFRLTMRVLSGVFSTWLTEYYDTESVQYKAWVEAYTTMVKRVINNSNLRNLGVVEVSVIEIREGSVWVYSEVKYEAIPEIIQQQTKAEWTKIIQDGIKDEEPQNEFVLDYTYFTCEPGRHDGTTLPAQLVCSSPPTFEKYCLAIVDYNSTTVRGFHGQQTDEFFETLLSGFTTSVSVSCENLVMPYVCGLVFPECETPTPYRLPPCADYCTALYSSCATYLTSFLSEADCYATSDVIDRCKTQPSPVSYCTGGTEHLCRNGPLITGKSECVSNNKRCDGSWACDDGSDESDGQCPAGITCPPGTTECLNGGIIIGSSGRERCHAVGGRCNSQTECTSHSDEIGCNDVCTDTEWRCTFGYNVATNSSCLALIELCDGTQHCTDNSDENGCDFAACDPVTEFRCASGVDFTSKRACIPLAERCDDTVDCVDASDEEYCHSTCPPIGYFMCADKRVLKLQDPNDVCIPTSATCDGAVNCDDLSDEHESGCTSCPGGEYRCTAGTVLGDATSVCVPKETSCTVIDTSRECTPSTYECDRKKDCSTNSDETGCTYACGADEFMCTTGAVIEAPNRGYCIPESYRCDRVQDCVDNSDEAGCEFSCAGEAEYQCVAQTIAAPPRRGFCVDVSVICDNVTDCEDGSDESGCDYSACVGDEFRCVTGVDSTSRKACTPSSNRCDDDVDCQDASDEDYCYPTCPPNQFMCLNKRNIKLLDHNDICVPDTAVCDGVTDCEDLSDEHESNCTTCPGQGYRCSSGVTAQDSNKVCVDKPGSCIPGDTSDECTPSTYECDRHPDCTTDADEANCTYACSQSQFQCLSDTILAAPQRGYCLQGSYECDRVQDCKDNSDESACNYTCSNGDFMCSTGVIAEAPNRGFCIQSMWACDRVSDCADGSDESSCSYACDPATEFMCETGTMDQEPFRGYCVGIDVKCDGHWNCTDGSDESAITCPTGTTCPTGQKRCYGDSATLIGSDSKSECHYLHQRCDGTEDCTSHSDELGCGETCTNGLFQCTLGYDPLTNSSCLELTKLCDGENDCTDASDEEGCDFTACDAATELRCTTGVDAATRRACTPVANRCDDDDDCTDASDEVYCYPTCPPNQFMCLNKRNIKLLDHNDICVANSVLCDGSVDCDDISDEHENNCTTCPNGGYRCTAGTAKLDVTTVCVVKDSWCTAGDTSAKCRPAQYGCDGKEDCSSGSDEIGCPARSCPNGYFACTTGAINFEPSRGYCVADASKCNGINDCTDGSDETNCPICSATMDFKNCEGCPNGYFDCGLQTGLRSKCILNDRKCNGNRDCANNADEQYCGQKCGTNLKCFRPLGDQFKCYGHARRCDGVRDCNNMGDIHDSDERDCVPEGYEPSCQAGDRFRCVNGYRISTPGYVSAGQRCILDTWHCDGRVDCSDGSDEVGCVYDKCTANQFKCATGALADKPYRGYCIGAEEECDGYFECEDGSDEMFCDQKPCADGLVRCANGGIDEINGDYCIPAGFVCDGGKDCTASTDERGCPCPAGERNCPNGGLDAYNGDFCIPNVWFCDGAPDCTNGKDEVNCGV